MAHYECSVCGETYCESLLCGGEKQRRYAESRRVAANIPDPSDIQIMLMNGGKIPVLGSSTAAGFDLYANEDHIFKEGETFCMPLGFATALPDDIHGRIESRSGNAVKGLVTLTGVIDSDYRGEWKAILHFLGPMKTNGYAERFHVARGERVAQCVLRSTVRRKWTPVDALEDTARGVGGFGSSGKA